MAIVLDELITRLRFKADDAGLRKSTQQLTGIQKAAKRAQSGLGDLRRAMVEAFAVRAVVDGARQVMGAVVDTNRTFQSLRASLKTVTGSADAAAVAFGRIRKFARETPFTVEQVTKAFIKLKALGLDASEESLRSYGNTASATGKSIGDVMEAVADATTFEFERLKEFGIKARVEGDAVALTFRGVTTRVAKDANSIERFLVGIGQTHFAGAMSEQMATLSGAFSNLQDSLDSFFVAIGEGGLNDALIEVSKGLGEMLGESDDLGKSLGELAGNVLREVFRMFKALVRGLKDIKREDIAAFFDKARRAIGAVIGVAKGIVAAFREFVALVGGTERAIQILLPTIAALKLGLGGLTAVAFGLGVALSQAFGPDRQEEARRMRDIIRQTNAENARRDKVISESRGKAETDARELAADIEAQNRKRVAGFGPGLTGGGERYKETIGVDAPGITTEQVEVERVGLATLGPQAKRFDAAAKKAIREQAKAAMEKAKASGLDPTLAFRGTGDRLRSREVAAREAFSQAIAEGTSVDRAIKEGLAVLQKEPKRAGVKAMGGGRKKKEKEYKPESVQRIESALEERVRETELRTFLQRRDLLGDDRQAAAAEAGRVKRRALERAVSEGRLSALGGEFAGTGTTQLLRDAGILGDSQTASPPVLTVTIVKADVDIEAPIQVNVPNATLAAGDVGQAVRKAVREELAVEVGKAIEGVLPKEAG